jgi:hypothetical protein
VMNMREEMLSDGKTKRFMSVKEGGKEVFIEIKNESLARAMHNVGAENFENISNVMGKAVGAMSTFQNFRRNMLINYNPSWFFINPIRDLQTGLMYSLAEESKAGGLIEGENLTDTSPQVGLTLKTCVAVRPTPSLMICSRSIRKVALPRA